MPDNDKDMRLLKILKNRDHPPTYDIKYGSMPYIIPSLTLHTNIQDIPEQEFSLFGEICVKVLRKVPITPENNSGEIEQIYNISSIQDMVNLIEQLGETISYDTWIIIKKCVDKIMIEKGKM